MDNNIFDINTFNIFQDQDYYYFFRALNNNDNKDFENGSIIDDNGDIYKIMTDREHYTKVPKEYDDDISLEEVYHHIKFNNRKDTNCISLTSNANAAAMYGRGSYKDRYIMVKIPKSVLGSKVYQAGPFMLSESSKRIDELIDAESDDMLKYYIDSITHANNQDDIDRTVTMATNDQQKTRSIFKGGIEYESSIADSMNYDALNKQQNFEKDKLVTKLNIMNKNIIPYVKNKKLIETIGSAFSSLELIHYGTIQKDNILEITSEQLDALSIVQQISTDEKNVDELKSVLISKILSKELSIDDFEYKNNKINNTNDYSIERMYNVTSGTIPYQEARDIYEKSYYLAKSKLRSNHIINQLLEQLQDYPELQQLLRREKDNLFGVEPEIHTRRSGRGYKISESVSLDFNDSQEQIFDLINNLSIEEYESIINNPDGSLRTLLNRYNKEKKNVVDKETYYAKAVINMFDWQSLHIKKISDEQMEELINKLKENNCVSIYEDLKNHRIKEQHIPNILLTKIIKDMKEIDLNAAFTIDELEDFLGYYEVQDTKIRLRSYQATAVKNIDESLQERQFTAAILPTGAGKSFVALTEMLQYQDKKILYLAPNTEILDQLANHIIKNVHGTKYTTGKTTEEIIKESFPNLELHTYAYLNDNHTNIRDSKYDLIVWDELHRTGAQEWGKNIQKLLNHQDENTKILSVTATPERDADGKDMADEWAKYFGYTDVEIARHKHLAINMSLEEAIRLGYIMHPKLVQCEYSLKDSDLLNDIEEKLMAYPESAKKTELLKKFDELRDRVSEADGIDKVLKDNIKKGGRYIVFCPIMTKKGQKLEDENGYEIDSRLSSTEVIEEYQNKMIDYLKGYIDEEDIEFHSMLGSYSKTKNANELKQFEKDTPGKTKFILVMNKLNEGKHVDGVNGLIWFRPLDENSRILYLQQLGRIIFSVDPNKEISDDERTVAIDLVNNSLRVNINREKRNLSSDIDKLHIVIDWMEEHKMACLDINSPNNTESRYASILKRIQDKYLKFVNDFDSIEKEPNKEEIYEVLLLGSSIDLWNMDIAEKIKVEGKEFEEDILDEFSITGTLRDLYELNEEMKSLGLAGQKEKIHEYRMIIENLGRLPKFRENIKFSDETDAGIYWYDAEEKIKQEAKRGNEDAIYILNMAENNKIDKLHEYRIIVEELGRFPKQSDEITFSDGKPVDYYIFNFLDKIKKDAKEGNEDALFILEMRKTQQDSKIDKTHELKIIIDQLGRFPNRNDEITFSDGTNVLDYFQNNINSIRRKAKRGNEEAVFVLDYHQKQKESKQFNNKVHEYRLAVEEKGRLIGKGKDDVDLLFSDGTKMGGYWNNKSKMIKQLAEEGDEDAIAILNVANNKVDKVHEYRLVVEKLGRLVSFSKTDNDYLFSDKSSMTYYWYRNETTLRKLAKEGNEDAQKIIDIANVTINEEKEVKKVLNVKSEDYNDEHTNNKTI